MAGLTAATLFELADLLFQPFEQVDLTIWHWLVMGFVLLIGSLCALDAIVTARTPQGALAWSFVLVLAPFVSIPLYFVFGQRRFRGYVDARRSHDKQAQGTESEIRKQLSKFIVHPEDELGRGRVLEQLASLPFTHGNDVELLIDGEATFSAILDAIEDAEEYVLCQFYIFRDDQLGRRLRQALLDKAADGVQVHVLYDEIGCSSTPNRYFDQMSDGGVEVSGFKTTRGWTNRFQLNFRNHRKIVVVDGIRAFVGGHNVGDEYMGGDKRMTPWRDTHVMVVGPAVLPIQLCFVEDWRWATSELLDLNWVPKASDEDRLMFVLPSSPADVFETCGLFFNHAINCAAKKIWIASPYFVPDQGIISALQLAVMRGVDVRILMPGMRDHHSTWLASHSFFEEVLTSGVRLFQMNEGFMHQKVVLIDDGISTIGTANFDNRSFRLNFEISILTLDEEFGSRVRKMLEKDFAASREITQEDCEQFSLWLKIGSSSARLLAPIL